VLRCDRDHLEMQLHGCPLRMLARGRARREKIAVLCRIAARSTRACSRAGFKVENRTWTPGAKGCCFLSVQRGG